MGPPTSETGLYDGRPAPSGADTCACAPVVTRTSPAATIHPVKNFIARAPVSSCPGALRSLARPSRIVISSRNPAVLGPDRGVFAGVARARRRHGPGEDFHALV